jgi:hypothetical protein
MNSGDKKVGQSVVYTTVMFLMMLITFNSFGQSKNEQDVWKLESDYWKYVKAGDLDLYRNLWHENFIGWPSVSAQPAKKDHITDWITAHTNKGEQLRWYHLEQGASQETENIIVVHYWITMFWVDKKDSGEPSTTRITHTWIKTGNTWQIIGGMSAPSTR